MVGQKLKEIIIDDMKISHLPEVVEIERASCTMPWSESLFYNEIQNPRSIPKVARRHDQVIGYVCANRILDEGHILNLAVHPDYRKLGIATALVEDMIGLLMHDDCRYLFLEVRASNEGAKRVYEKLNFKFLGIRKNYYISPVEDAVIMVLKLVDEQAP
jgi:[ribosomal protein S18]-alanine N-acetyltransferase